MKLTMKDIEESGDQLILSLINNNMLILKQINMLSKELKKRVDIDIIDKIINLSEM